MKPERLTEIESLCKAALEQEPERRADFLLPRARTMRSFVAK
jgi:hypothetical protein